MFCYSAVIPGDLQRASVIRLPVRPHWRGRPSLFLLCDQDPPDLPAQGQLNAFFANVISGWTVANSLINTNQSTEANFKESDLQIAKLGTSFEMVHKMTLVDITINTPGRLQGSDVKYAVDTKLVGVNNIIPLYVLESSTAHAIAVIAPKNQSGNFVSLSVDNDIKTFQYTKNMESGKVYSMTTGAIDVVLPVDFVATYNLATNNTFTSNHNPNSYRYFAGGKVKVSGVEMVPTDVLKGLASGILIGAKKYHLPTVREWMSILPPNITTSSYGSEFYQPEGIEGTTTNRISSFSREATERTGLGETVEWGRISAGSYYMPSRMFYNEYKTSASYVNSTRRHAYAIRLKKTDDEGSKGYGPYTCAFRYTYTTQDASCNNYPSLRVKVRYLGPSSSTTLSDICNDAYWSASSVSYYEFIFSASGYTHSLSSPDTDSNNNYLDYNSVNYPTGVSVPNNGLYWTSTVSGMDAHFHMGFSDTYVMCNATSGRRNDHFPVRLFSDYQ